MVEELKIESKMTEKEQTNKKDKSMVETQKVLEEIRRNGQYEEKK